MSARFAMRDCEQCRRHVLATADGRCPRCDRPLVGGAGPRTLQVRLSDRSDLPHVCLQCGAPTHRVARVRVRGPAAAPGPQGREKGGIPPWVHLLTGHLTLLISLIGALSKPLVGASARRRLRFAVPVRQCRECGRAGSTQGFAADFGARSMAFEAHPRFAQALHRALRDARREAMLRKPPARGDDEGRPVSPS